MNTDRYW